MSRSQRLKARAGLLRRSGPPEGENLNTPVQIKSSEHQEIAIVRPTSAIELPDMRFALNLDRCVSPDRTSLFLRGWLWDPLHQLTQLELVFGGHHCSVPAASLIRYPRPDVAVHCSTRFSDGSFDNHGFVAFVETGAPKQERGLLRALLKNGDSAELHIQPPLDPFIAQRHILDSIPGEPFFCSRLMADHIHPALERVRSRIPSAAAGRTIIFGKPPSDPHFTIIVPLYKRLDLMEHQLAQFANDSTLRSCELVYVLDDPIMSAEFEFYSFHLWQLYQVPFKVVVMTRHSGYSGANNAGAAASSSSLVLFLNSDVFPLKAGSLTRLVALYQHKQEVGALGCKLLYEDRSIQHAGMYFYQDYHPNKLWINMHYYKGLPATWAGASEDRFVPAVTGATLLIRRSLFEKIGGWDESYVLANYEDSDLCLRLSKVGYSSWYCSSVEMYHLERQSQGPGEEEAVRRNSDFYNRWLQTHRWNDLISEVMNRQRSLSTR